MKKAIALLIIVLLLCTTLTATAFNKEQKEQTKKFTISIYTDGDNGFCYRGEGIEYEYDEEDIIILYPDSIEKLGDEF